MIQMDVQTLVLSCKATIALENQAFVNRFVQMVKDFQVRHVMTEI